MGFAGTHLKLELELQLVQIKQVEMRLESLDYKQTH